MIHKILCRLVSVRSFVFAALALAMSTMSASAAITVDPAKLTLRDGTFGEYYSGYMYFNGIDSYCTFSGGTAPYYVTVKEGTTKTLPAGIRINGSGEDYISFFGKAEAPGTYEVEVTITDSSEPAESVDATYTFTINKAALAVDSSQLALKSGTVDEYYYASITDSISGGAKPYAVTVDIPAQLPPGVTLSGSGTSYIYFSGTPTTAGSYNVDVTVADQDSTQVQATYTITINEPPQSVPTSYVGPGGAPSNHDCVELNTSMTTLQSGWYVASGTLNFGTGGIVIDGDVKLVLEDGASLTVQGGYGKAGIKVTDLNSLTIYAQSAGTGALNATGGDWSAGIGGEDYDGNCGTVTIYGGNITATGSGDGAGIGAASYGYGGYVSVYGGTVTAECGGYDYSGIGSSENGKHGTLTVGDNVVVKAGSWKPLEDYTICEHNSDDTITLDVANDGDYTPPTRCYFYLVTNDEEPPALPTITYIDGTDGVTVLTDLLPTNYTPGVSYPLVALPGAYDGVSKKGYSFNGWFRDKNFTDGPVYYLESSDTGNLEFYAKFTAVVFPITYFDYDAELGYDQELSLNPSSFTIADTPVTLPSPAAKEGFTFVGWCEKSDRSDTPVMTIPADTVEGKGFYAKWTESGSGGGGDEPGDGTVLVSFVDASGSPMQQNCTPVTAETTTLTAGGWYVVNDDVEIGNGELGVSIAVEGAVNLVLMDGKTLTVNGASFNAAIGVPSGASLTIYGQSAGTGALYANGNTAGAGIGGGQNGACGSVTINGGHIEAVGGDYGAGIGGGYAGAGGSVTINGGYVRAVGGNISTPGIGRGGVVGSAVPPSSGTLIVGTDVVVKAGSISILGDDDVKTADPSTHQIAIDDEWRYFLIEKIPSSPEPGVISNIEYREKDGTLIENLTPTTYEEGVGVSLATAVPPTRPGYDFGGWYDNYNLEGTPVTVVPTTATGTLCFFAKWIGKTYNIRYFVEGVEDTSLTPKTYTAGSVAILPMSLTKPNYVFDYWCDNPELTGDSFYYIPTTSVGDVTVYARFKPQNFSITYYDGSQTLSLAPSSYNIESETIVLPTPVKTDYVFDGWYTNSVFEGSTVTTIPTGSTGVRKFYSKWHVAPPATASDVPYTAGGSAGTHDCKILSTRVTELVDDWYVLSDDIDYGTTGLTVSGDVKLILADDATLTVEGDYSKAGIYVPVGSSLTIYAQSAGTGAILATGGSGAAGIGGNRGPMEDEEPDEGTCGTVVINGGIITATGGDWAAGIGGGSSGNGGTVTINGGVVTATGVSGGAGIGGGAFKDGGSVTVNGGTVTAVGGAYSATIAAGIGGGVFASSQGTLSIAADITVKSGDAADDLTVLASAAGSVTLDGKQYYAVIPLEQYNITYMDGASPLNLAPAKYTAGQVCELPTPTKSGYTFAGWYTKSDFSTLPVSAIPADASGAKTFYSMWVEGNVGGVPEFTIDSNGKLTAANLKGNPVVTIPDVVTEIDRNVFKDVTTLKNVTILGNVKKIGNYAFQGCTGLESVTFGNGVEVIGDLSFDGCTALESVTFGNTIETIGEAAFQNTPALTSPEGGLYFPDSVTSIGRNAFYNTGLAKASLPGGLYSEGSPLSSDFFNVNSETRTELVYRTDAVVFYISGGDLTAVDTKANTAMTIPNTVTRIFPGVFEDCTLVETVTIPNSVTNIQMQAFKGCTGLTGVAIPDSVEYLGDYAFQGCTALETVTIGNGVASIPMYAFDGCTSLASVTIGSGVESIMTHAFSGCEALAGIVIPDGVTTLQAYAFDGCTSLQSAVIGNGITSLEGHVFGGCSTLSSVTIGSGVTTIKSFAFTGCSSLAELTIPANVTTIASYAFSEVGLVNIVIPDTVTTFGDHVFYGCSSLESVTLGSAITEIGDGMFFGLTALESVMLRGNVTSIGENAFFNCTSLAAFSFPATVTSVGESAFWGCSALAIEVRFPENSTIGRFAFFGSGITYVFVDKGGQVGSLAFAECKNLARAIIADKESTSGSKLLLSTKGRRLLGAASEDATEIADHAFFGCSDLESVALGKSVDSVGQGAFSGCPKLATFNVDPENDNYKTENGMLLTKDGATLISAFGEETSVTVPDGVVTVSGSAFAGYATLQSVVLPSGVTTIGEAAFSNATAFASITIPASVTTIDANAFCDTVLATVYVSKGDTARVQALVVGTGYAGTVAYIESGSEPATEWPADTSTVEGQTAAEAYGVTGDLATADAKKLGDWAKENSVEFGGTILTDAYLLNCANTAAAVEAATETAEEAIKITAISFNELGEPVLTCPDSYGNGTVVIEGAASLTTPMLWHDKTSGDKFFRTVLKP